jgi:predicted RNase H-like HicB family nuclease
MAPKIPYKIKNPLSERANPIEKNTPKPTDLVSLDDSEIFLAHRVKKPNDSFGQTVEKVRKRIKYAIKTKKIGCKGKKIQFGDLIWHIHSIKDWSDSFKDLNFGNANITAAPASCNGLIASKPETLKKCHEEISKQLKNTIELEEKNTKLKKEIERLQPFELRNEKRIESCRQGGRNGKGVKKNYKP